MATNEDTRRVYMLSRVRGMDGEALPRRTVQELPAAFARALIFQGRAAPYEGQDQAGGRTRLQDVPCKELADALASVNDPSAVREAAETDGRDCAAEHYEARLLELEDEAEA